jgi:hypothetical protein
MMDRYKLAVMWAALNASPNGEYVDRVMKLLEKEIGYDYALTVWRELVINNKIDAVLLEQTHVPKIAS